MMEKNTHRNVIPIIGERDIIPFGKYKGKALLDVYSQDPSYVHWMADNVSNYKIELNYHWIEILKEDEVAPRNGIYIIACRYDNHLGYEIYKLKKGDCFGGLYKNENAHSDGYYPIDCLAYYKIQEYSPDNKQWSHITTHNLCVSVFAIQQGNNIEYALSYDGWGVERSFEELKEDILESFRIGVRDYGYTGAILTERNITHDKILAGINIPAYTEEMHAKHWQMLASNK